MEIIPFTKFLLKIGGILPIFPEKKSFRNRLFEILKLILFIVAPVYTTFSLLIFGVLNLDDLTRATISMYQGIGFVMGISMHLAIWFDSAKVQALLKRIEELVKKSIFSKKNNCNLLN